MHLDGKDAGWKLRNRHKPPARVSSSWGLRSASDPSALLSFSSQAAPHLCVLEERGGLSPSPSTPSSRQRNPGKIKVPTAPRWPGEKGSDSRGSSQLFLVWQRTVLRYNFFPGGTTPGEGERSHSGHERRGHRMPAGSKTTKWQGKKTPSCQELIVQLMGSWQRLFSSVGKN